MQSDVVTGKVKGHNQALSAYCVLWGSDTERDISGEYFTSDTDFGDISKPVGIYINIEDSVRGTCDEVRVGTATLKRDEHGIFMQGVLEPVENSTAQYIDSINCLIEKSILYAYTWASFAELRDVNYLNEGGSIRIWPIEGVEIGVMPSDSR